MLACVTGQVRRSHDAIDDLAELLGGDRIIHCLPDSDERRRVEETPSRPAFAYVTEAAGDLIAPMCGHCTGCLPPLSCSSVYGIR